MGQIRLLLIVLLALQSQILFAAEFDHGKWHGLLQNHVELLDEGRTSRVDYAGIMENRSELDAYLQSLSLIDQLVFDSWSTDEQLALLINAYNAATVSLILSRYPNLKSIKDIGSLFRSPWRREFISLLGKTMTLDEIEHQLIRGSGRYKEPRIHFAVNCAAIGCPALSNKAYEPETLEQQLESASKMFLSDRSRNYFSENRLYVSSIFKWYREDFEQGWQGINSLQEFLSGYSAELELDDQALANLQNNRLRIRFLSYDWDLNRSD